MIKEKFRSFLIYQRIIILHKYQVTNGQTLSNFIISYIKSWIRTTYSWTHKLHIDKYLDEYSFRINRSIFKNSIFHKLIERMMVADTVEYKDIIVVSK